MDAAPPDSHTRDLQAVRLRRAELRESLHSIEEAIAAPATGRAVIWGERVHDAVSQLSHDFAEHIDVTEGPDGLHQNIIAGDLRLVNGVTALADEHVRITAEIAQLGSATEAPVTETDVPAVREQANVLMGRIVRHRQRGADLIWEAYASDIGGGD